MDSRHFDTLTRVLSIPDSRRRLLALLATLPLLGGLLGIRNPEDAAAKERRRRRKQRHKRRKTPGTRKHGCTLKSRATVCAGRCGPVKSRQTCGKTVDCGSCACSPPCPVCFTCQDEGATSPGVCVVDATRVGASCGGGKVCQPDGACACIPRTECPVDKVCGTIPDGCGGTLDCGTCANPTPVCDVDNACVACESSDECASGEICDGGSCQPCDVCDDGCDFATVQAAIDATTPQLTRIRVCPGAYSGDATQFGAFFIDRALTLIGAGDGADPGTNTVLSPIQTNKNVIQVSSAGTVRLEQLHVTGGSGANGGGVLLFGSTVTVARCTITGNHPTDAGGGITVLGVADVSLVDTLVTLNSATGHGAGIEIQSSTLTLDTLSRITGNDGGVGGVGGIRAGGSTVTLPSVDNVTGNTPKDCEGDTFTGPGAVCLTT